MAAQREVGESGPPCHRLRLAADNFSAANQRRRQCCPTLLARPWLADLESGDGDSPRRLLDLARISNLAKPTVFRLSALCPSHRRHGRPPRIAPTGWASEVRAGRSLCRLSDLQQAETCTLLCGWLSRWTDGQAARRDIPPWAMPCHATACPHFCYAHHPRLSTVMCLQVEQACV